MKRREIARASVTICFACLVLQAVYVREIHHTLAATVFGIALSATGVLAGLGYLRSARESRPAHVIPAIRRYAAAHRQLLEASIAAWEATGDRNDGIPPHVRAAHDRALDDLPRLLTWPVLLLELHVARQLDYRHRTRAAS